MGRWDEGAADGRREESLWMEQGRGYWAVAEGREGLVRGGVVLY